MKKDKRVHDHWALIEKLIDETFGCGKLTGLSGWDGANVVEADINLSNNLLTGTPHEIKHDVELIHYTSVNALFEIINSKKLRMFNAAQMNDPKELLFSINKLENLIPPDFKELINNIFLFSFCEYNSTDENREHFNLWREYGDDGNGVGIVFKLANLDLENKWINSAIGKIDYNSDSYSLRGIKNFFSSVQKIREEENLTINILPKIILQLLSLNKSFLWSEEKEIRLFRFIEWDKLNLRFKFDNPYFSNEIKTTFQNNMLKYFIEIDLDNKSRLENAKKICEDANNINRPMKFTESQAFDIYPALRIKKIIFGYKISRETKSEIFDAIRLLTSQKLGYSIYYENSNLTTFFQ